MKSSPPQLMATLRKISLSDERYHMLLNLLDWMRDNEPASAPAAP
jgi:hypothetical protein